MVGVAMPSASVGLERSPSAALITAAGELSSGRAPPLLLPLNCTTHGGPGATPKAHMPGDKPKVARAGGSAGAINHGLEPPLAPQLPTVPQAKGIALGVRH